MDSMMCTDIADVSFLYRLKKTVEQGFGLTIILCHRETSTCNNEWQYIMWRGESNPIISYLNQNDLCYCGGKKSLYSVHSQAIKDMCSSFHNGVYMCVCVCWATQSRRVRRRLTRRRLFLSGGYCAVSRSLWHQLLLSGAWLMLRCKAPLISLDEKGLDWEGMEKGAEACQKSPSLPVYAILSLANHTLPFCQSLPLAQSLDW